MLGLTLPDNFKDIGLTLPMYIRLLKVNIKVERILHQVHLELKFHYVVVELNPTSYGSENRTPPEQFWGELATQLLLAAAPFCRAC